MMQKTKFNHGDRVTWTEFSGAVCTGYLVYEVRAADGVPTDWWEIAVDRDCYFKACRTATEMNLGWVTRRADLHQLTLVAEKQQDAETD